MADVISLLPNDSHMSITTDLPQNLKERQKAPYDAIANLYNEWTS